MGCSASCSERIAMSLFGKQQSSENKAKLDRKLYIAKESPEPVFDLSDCQLRHVPSGIYSIFKVFRKEYLYLNNNRLQSLDNGGQIADLYLLKVLNISFNEFHLLTNDINCLVNLTELHIQHNKLKTLPEGVQHLQCLRILDASHNKLVHLTPHLGKLQCLQKLNIVGNPDLTELCVELCCARSLIQLELDQNNFNYPPQEIVALGTVEILKYLCAMFGTEYVQPELVDNSFDLIPTIQVVNPFSKQPAVVWEDKEAEMIEQESKLHLAAKKRRELFLSQVLQDQSELDAEIVKVHEHKDVERQRLIQLIQNEEKDIKSLVENFIQSNNLKPEVIQQQLQHEQSEHDHLLQIIKQNYDNIRKTDVLKAMEKILDESYAIQNVKSEQFNISDNMKQNMLEEDLKSTGKLEKLLSVKDKYHTALTQQLLDDQDMQKAAVASLIERIDTRTWSLNQEIFLITSNLAKLSILEQEKKKIHVVYNYNELLMQRTQLLNLLDDLMSQKNKRRSQLIATMKDMESANDAKSSDFWLKSYQKVVESAPKSLLDIGKNIDPLLANHLLQEGVIHCLPFLVKFLFNNESLASITSQMLKENGVTLPSDRDNILRAIECYVAEKHKNNNFAEATPEAASTSCVGEEEPLGVVSAAADGAAPDSECVICMETRCEVVFVPCGHLCCCLVCSHKPSVQLCPMCRSTIDKKIKIIAV